MAAKQRVGGVVVKTLYTFYNWFGYASVYYSLYAVVLYYFLFAKNVKVALKDYYAHLNIPFSHKNFFNHLFNYAVATSDRFISKAHPENYHFINQNREQLLSEVKNGSILLSNHFGGWAVASNYFSASDVKINVVMNEAMIQNAKEFEAMINKKNEACVNIIDLSKGNIATSISIGTALLNNESVAFMGDRALNEKYEYAMPFFNDTAHFNKNPFLFAYKTKKPIMVIFVVYQTIKTYEMIFEKIELDYTLNENDAIHKGIEQYVQILSNTLIKHPFQWFNFYNFWEKK